jgi:hypothetical protein
MTIKTKHQIKQEKRHASFYKDWQKLAANAQSKKSVIMQILADKYEISVKTAYAWRNRMINA